MENLIDFSLYDEKGVKYITKVTPGEAGSLMIYGKKCFQRLKELKAAENGNRDCGGAGASSSSSKHSSLKSKKRKWDQQATEKFLSECVKFRKWLRQKIPPLNAWVAITQGTCKALLPLAQFKDQYVFTVAECKEKMRTLKRSFKECKEGKHNGDQWTHYWFMYYIFDEKIVAGDVTLAPEGFHFESTTVEGTFEVLDGTLVPLASSSLLISSPSEEEEKAHDENNNGSEIVTSVITGNDNEPQAPFDSPAASPFNSPFTSPLKKKIRKSVTCKANLFKGPAHENNDNENDGVHILGDVNDDMTLKGNNNAQVNVHRGPLVVHTPGKNTLKQKTPLKKTSATVNANILKSPHINSPRKRKTPKHVLNFDSDTTEIFVSECLELKADLQSETIALKTWKDLAAALETKHNIQMKWDVCRDKFSQMKEFFLGTLLPLEGYMSGKKWPYYHSFCDLYDIPSEYHSIMICQTEANNDEGSDQEEVPGKGSKLWPLTNVELLLDLFKTKKEKFESTRSFLKHALLFSQIAMQLHDFTGRQYSAKQCQDKYGRLMDHFRIEYDKTNKTGAAPSEWEHFKKMLDMYKGNPTLVAPYLSTVGTAFKYCANGVQQASGSGEGSRSRPKHEYKPKTDKAKGRAPEKKNFKTSYQEVTTSKLQNQVELNNELRLLRLTLEKGAIDRKGYMDRLIDKL